jgi:hypothetical protein
MKTLLAIAVLLLAGLLCLGIYNSYQAHRERQEDATAYSALDAITAKLAACKKPISPDTAPCTGSRAFCEGQRLGAEMSQQVHNGVCEDDARDARNEWAAKYPRQAARGAR